MSQSRIKNTNSFNNPGTYRTKESREAATARLLAILAKILKETPLISANNLKIRAKELNGTASGEICRRVYMAHRRSL